MLKNKKYINDKTAVLVSEVKRVYDNPTIEEINLVNVYEWKYPYTIPFDFIKIYDSNQKFNYEAGINYSINKEQRSRYEELNKEFLTNLILTWKRKNEKDYFYHNKTTTFQYDKKNRILSFRGFSNLDVTLALCIATSYLNGKLNFNIFKNKNLTNFFEKCYEQIMNDENLYINLIKQIQLNILFQPKFIIRLK